VRVQHSRWIGLMALALVVTVCSTDDVEPTGTLVTTGDVSPAADVPVAAETALRTTAGQPEVGAALGVVAAGIADLQIEGRTADYEPLGPDDIVDALARLDWAEILTAGHPLQIAARIERAVLDTPAAARDSDPGSEAASRGATASLPTPARQSQVAVLAVYEFRFDSARKEQQISDGTKSGTVGMEVDVSFDEPSGRETTTVTVDGDVTDSATGERVIAHNESKSYHDACWGEDGARESGTSTTTQVTTESATGSETSERSRKTTVRRETDGSVTIGVSVTIDGHTVGIRRGDSVASGPQGETLSTEGDQITFTIRTDEGETTVSVDKDVTFSDETIQQALDEIGDADKLDSDVESAGEALRRPLSPSSRGADEFCLKLSVDPTSGSLEADGDTLTFNATVLDWNSRPVVSAVVTVEGARLGSVSPKLGPASTEGVWTTTYTSGEEGSETLAFEAARFGYTVQRTVRLNIGSGYAFEWSRSEAGQTASVSATSCDGTSWTGDFRFEGTPGGAEISMATGFNLQVDGAIGETDLVSTGTIGTAGEYLPIEMPYSLTVTLDTEARTADVRLVRSGGGVIVAEGRRVPIPTEGFPEFVFTTQLVAPTGCA